VKLRPEELTPGAGPWEALGPSLLLALLGFALFPLALRAWRRIGPGPPADASSPSGGEAGLAALVFLAVQVLFAALWPASERPGALELLARSALAFAVAGATVFSRARRRGRAALQGLGLGAERGLGSLGPSLGLYLLLLPAGVAVSLLWPLALEAAGHEWRPHPLFALFRETSSLERIAALLLAVLLQPALEELLFRGLLQGWLQALLGPRQGVLFGALLFASLHGVDSLLPILCLGLLLGALRQRSGRLLPGFGVHALHNGLMLGYDLGLRSLLRHPLP
jgi:membrane protease YdiL (CAAX protease family)